MKLLISAVLLVLVLLVGCGPQPKEVTVGELSFNSSQYAKAYVRTEGTLIHDRDIKSQVEGKGCVEGKIYRLQGDDNHEILVFSLGQGKLQEGYWKSIVGHWEPFEGGYRLEIN